VRALRSNVPDDAVTSMQYAKNLALGNGLVFNAGERVDGYTNFLWVLFMTPIYALCHALGVAFVPVMALVGVMLAAVCVGLTYWIALGIWGRNLAVGGAVLFCLVDGSFTTWAGLGLETHFLASFLLLALVAARSSARFRGLWLGLALLGAHLTRPDAALFGACMLGSELVSAALAYRRGGGACRAQLHDTGVALATWLVPYAAYFVWHYLYYGAPFPNTYYVKLGGGIDGWARGASYVAGFFEVRAWVPALGLLGLLAWRDATLRALLFYLPAHLLYVTYVGGDFMPGHRFLVPQIPLFALLVGAAIAELWTLAAREPARNAAHRLSLSREHLAGFGVGLTLCAFAGLAWRERERGPLDESVATFRDAHDRQRRLLTWLRDVKPPGASFATGLIGHTGFYGEVRVIDTFGIIDPVVAKRKVSTLGQGHAGHEKQATVTETLARKPTYVGIYVLPVDLWRHGYYLDTDVPSNTVPGIWVRDTLADKGRLIPGTRLDFETREGGFTSLGRAFEEWPARGSAPGQGLIEGAEGGFINSFHKTLGYVATGTLRSAPFELRGDYLLFRVAGGNDPQRLQVALKLGDTLAFRATGRQTDVMGRVAWNIAPYRGKLATLELTDDSPDPWGYLALDALAQWDATR
jgi:arabinofuranosyltransferase